MEDAAKASRRRALGLNECAVMPEDSMTPLTDMLRNLFEKGVPQDAILIAIEGAELALQEQAKCMHLHASADESADSQAERRREKDRIRAKQRRESLRTSADNPQTSADCGTAALVPQVKNLTSFSKDSKNLKNLTEDSLSVTAIESADVRRQKRGCRLPDDWAPDDPDFANEILGNQRAQSELDRFRDYWKSQPGARGVKLDWFATWRNWVRTANERSQSHRNGKSQLMQAFDRLGERISREEEPDFELRESDLLGLPFGSVR